MEAFWNVSDVVRGVSERFVAVSNVSEVFQSFSQVFRRTSNVFWNVSDVFRSVSGVSRGVPEAFRRRLYCLVGRLFSLPQTGRPDGEKLNLLNSD